MAKNEITLQAPRTARTARPCISLDITRRLERTAAMRNLAALYTFLLEETVTPRQSVYYLYAQLTAIATLAPADMGSGWRACFLLLFCLAIGKTRGCRHTRPGRHKPGTRT